MIVTQSLIGSPPAVYEVDDFTSKANRLIGKIVRKDQGFLGFQEVNRVQDLVVVGVRQISFITVEDGDHLQTQAIAVLEVQWVKTLARWESQDSAT